MNFLENLQRNEEAIEVYMKKGNSQTNLFQFKSMIQLFNQIHNMFMLYERRFQFYYFIGNSLQNLLMHEEAIQIYDMIKPFNQNQNNLKAYIKKGISLQNFNKAEDAQLMFTNDQQIQNTK